MKTVNIGELKNHLSAYLQYVRNGEEVVIRDRNVAVARILPIRESDQPSDREAEIAAMVASGALKLAEKPMDWEEFWARPRPDISHDVAVQAVSESRGDR